MKEENLISTLKELLRCYEYVHFSDSPFYLEINMWRKRFTEANNLSPFHAKHFACIPSENLIKTTPEDFINSLGDM